MRYVIVAICVVIGVLIPPIGLIMLGALGYWAWKRYSLAQKLKAKAQPIVDYYKTHEVKIVEKPKPETPELPPAAA